MFRDRLRSEKLWDRIVTADEAALLITDGMAVGMSGFTRAGEANTSERRVRLSWDSRIGENLNPLSKREV
ncbi:hypothetical protein GFM44_35445, partial [Rhizobium leguminosarum bv. viciae]|nr:hypothetical protein [Rhizobium leguminosarum bv. viciae]